VLNLHLKGRWGNGVSSHQTKRQHFQMNPILNLPIRWKVKNDQQRSHLTIRFHRRFGSAKRGEDGALGGRLRGAAMKQTKQQWK
jgi:hypothetical protein